MTLFAAFSLCTHLFFDRIVRKSFIYRLQFFLKLNTYVQKNREQLHVIRQSVEFDDFLYYTLCSIK